MERTLRAIFGFNLDRGVVDAKAVIELVRQFMQSAVARMAFWGTAHHPPALKGALLDNIAPAMSHDGTSFAGWPPKSARSPPASPSRSGRRIRDLSGRLSDGRMRSIARLSDWNWWMAASMATGTSSPWVSASTISPRSAWLRCSVR